MIENVDGRKKSSEGSKTWRKLVSVAWVDCGAGL